MPPIYKYSNSTYIELALSSSFFIYRENDDIDNVDQRDQ